MSTVHAHIEIDAPVQKVWDTVMDPYHLKDWVVQSGARTKKDVEAFIRDNEQLLFCRDICHGLKHYRLDDSGKRKPIPALQLDRGGGLVTITTPPHAPENSDP